MGKGKGLGSGSSGGGFSEEQLTIYKECFRLMDIDKDGVINKADLRASFDNVGRLMTEEELDSMLAEIGGPCNVENMIKCFESKMAGEVNDADETIITAIKCHDEEITETVKGVTTVRHLMEPEEFKHQLMTFGDKMTAEEIDDIFGEFEFDDDGFIVTNSVVDLFVAGGMDEKKEEDKKKKEDEQKKAEAAAAAAEAAKTSAAEDGGKKKKKKKKAAK